MLGNLTAVVLSLGSLWSNHEDAVLRWGQPISAVVVLLLLYTGWKGGELATAIV
jgi:uncharacterized membrane protein